MATNPLTQYMDHFDRALQMVVKPRVFDLERPLNDFGNWALIWHYTVRFEGTFREPEPVCTITGATLWAGDNHVELPLSMFSGADISDAEADAVTAEFDKLARMDADRRVYP